MMKPCCVCGVKDHIENMNGVWFVDEEPMEQWMCQHCWDDVNGRLPTPRAVDKRRARQNLTANLVPPSLATNAHRSAFTYERSNPMKFKEKLQKLFEEYLATLDDTEEHEGYCTDRVEAASVFDNFMAWLEKRNA